MLPHFGFGDSELALNDFLYTHTHTHTHTHPPPVSAHICVFLFFVVVDD